MTSFRLVMQSEPGIGTEFVLEGAELFVGRDPGNNIVINDPEVSRRHARFVLLGDTYTVEDLGSTNGTFIRGQRLAAPVILKPGEIIMFGEHVTVRFEVTGINPEATVAAYRPRVQATQQPVAPQVSPVPPFSSQPAAPVQTPPPSYTPPVPSIAPAVTPPVAPPRVASQPVPPVRKKKSGWLVALLVVIGIIVVFCIIPWIIIEATNSYCALFPGIFNAVQPGVCP